MQKASFLTSKINRINLYYDFLVKVILLLFSLRNFILYIIITFIGRVRKSQSRRGTQSLGSRLYFSIPLFYVSYRPFFLILSDFCSFSSLGDFTTICSPGEAMANKYLQWLDRFDSYYGSIPNYILKKKETSTWHNNKLPSHENNKFTIAWKIILPEIIWIFRDFDIAYAKWMELITQYNRTLFIILLFLHGPKWSISECTYSVGTYYCPLTTNFLTQVNAPKPWASGLHHREIMCYSKQTY